MSAIPQGSVPGLVLFYVFIKGYIVGLSAPAASLQMTPS